MCAYYVVGATTLVYTYTCSGLIWLTRLHIVKAIVNTSTCWSYCDCVSESIGFRQVFIRQREYTLCVSAFALGTLIRSNTRDTPTPYFDSRHTDLNRLAPTVGSHMLAFDIVIGMLWSKCALGFMYDGAPWQWVGSDQW